MQIQSLGKFSDYLSDKEVKYSKYCAGKLKEVDWGEGFLGIPRITQAINIQPDQINCLGKEHCFKR